MVKLANIDLNLLVVFDLLYQEQNTQRVALRIGITQPAVSHALKRLRLLLVSMAIYFDPPLANKIDPPIIV
ncbi:MAG: LysR family transcriptional regulator [Marinobacter sp.]